MSRALTRLSPGALPLAASGAQPLQQNAYKVELVRGAVQEALLAIAG